jgi:lipopolysaccharide transport system ATP-binding protein
MKSRIHCERVTKLFPAHPSDHFVSLWAALFSANAKRDYNTAINGVSLTVAKGERLGVIGPNGAGKSTLLHMIAGISRPDSGVLEVEGRVHSLLTIGAGIREELTGRDNIYLEAEVHGISRPEVDARLPEIIAFAELGEFIDRPVRTYSSGMKARLGFSALSFVEADILLIDEVLSVGDAAFALKAQAQVKKLCGAGSIVIIVSHGMASIVDLCTRCIWLDGGRLVMDGDPAEVTEAYLETVRSNDDRALRTRFGNNLDVIETEVAAIRTLRLVDGSGSPLGSTIVTPASVALEAELWQSSLLEDGAGLVLRLERSDGLIMSNGGLSQLPSSTDGTYSLRVELPDVPIGGGLYKLTLGIWLQGRCWASRAVLFEAIPRKLPAGGNPVFLTSVTVGRARSGMQG